jgi:hypothetical protein
MNEFLNNLKTQAEQNPMVAIVAGAGLLSAAGKFLNAASNRNNARTWKKEVDRRVRNSQMK